MAFLPSQCLDRANCRELFRRGHRCVDCGRPWYQHDGLETERIAISTNIESSPLLLLPKEHLAEPTEAIRNKTKSQASYDKPLRVDHPER
eukprot:658201-Amphidinium_carterae.1